MLRRLFNRIADKKMLRSEGVKTSVQYSVIINNEEIQYFSDYRDALNYIGKFRSVNQIFNLAVFRVEFYSLTNDYKNV